MIDARRMEVYTALFDDKGNRIRLTSAEIIDEHSFADILKDHQVLFFGDGAQKCEELLGQHPNAQFDGGFVNSAAYLASTAQHKFDAVAFEDVVYFEPFYLKDFIAGKKAF